MTVIIRGGRRSQLGAMHISESCPAALRHGEMLVCCWKGFVWPHPVRRGAGLIHLTIKGANSALGVRV